MVQDQPESGQRDTAAAEPGKQSKPGPPGKEKAGDPTIGRQLATDPTMIEPPRWRETTSAIGIGVVASGIAQILLLMEGIDIMIVQGLFVVGMIGIAGGVSLGVISYRRASLRRHRELIKTLEARGESDTMSEAIRALRRQQELIEELKEELPEHRDQIEELLEALPRQQELVNDLIREEISKLEELEEELSQ